MKILEDIKRLSPEDQLDAFAALIKQVADAMHTDAVQTKAQLIVQEQTRERRERPRNE
jgi:hypothetical protein